MRTGIRCTTFVKFPVALSGGSSANFAPVAELMLITLPSTRQSRYASTLISTDWPGCIRATCVSLKLAVTQAPVSATIHING